MTDPTPLYRNLVLETAMAEGCPTEVTKEAWAELEKTFEARYGINDGVSADMLDAVDKDAFAHGVAYGYTAGRVARWDALVKGSPRLLDAILRQVHEFFHDEPFGQHDGSAPDCTDCPTVAALAADAAAAFFHALPQVPDVYVREDDDLDDDDDDEWCGPEETVVAIVLPDTITERLPREDGPYDAEIERLADRAEQGYDQTQLIPLVGTSALHASVPNEWRPAADSEIQRD